MLTHALPLKLEDILEEPQEDISEVSAEVSFTLDDIINEKLFNPTDKTFNNLITDDDLFLDDDFEEQSSSIGKQIKSAKNTVTESNSKNKSTHDVATSSTVQQNLGLTRIREV